MMRSLYSGVSGLRNHQTRMDVIGNNIANVNTVGFKAGRTIFQDMYSQNMRAASSPGRTTGGTNPQQVGLGVSLSTIDTLFTRSAAQTTGNTYDLMIENDGFFIVRNGTATTYEEFYTRAGNFYEDKAGYLVTANGFYLQGYKAQITEGAAPTEEVKAIPKAADADVATGISTPPTGLTVEMGKGLGDEGNNLKFEITINSEGKAVLRTYANVNPADPRLISESEPFDLKNAGTEPYTIPTESGLRITLAAGFPTTALTEGSKFVYTTGTEGQDATERGDPISFITNEMDRIYIDKNLYNVSIDKNGNITALVKSTGTILNPADGTLLPVDANQRVTIGRIAVATFDNQQGLEKVGTNLYRSTSNTGTAQYKHPGSDGAGAINPGALEMSNVDLSQEFTDMIVTQRGFQANSRIITVSDTLLEELVNLKR